MKKTLLFLIASFFITSNIISQVTAVKYMIEIDDETGYYDCKLVVEEGFTDTYQERIQFNSQFVIVVPTGASFQFIESFNPKLDNENQWSVDPTNWILINSAISPEEQPENDFYAYAPEIVEEASYNDLVADDVIDLFRIDVEESCNLEVRPLNNDIDPVLIDGESYMQGFTLGSTTQIYNGNQLPSSFDADFAISGNSYIICPGECVEIAPKLDCAPLEVEYMWNTGENTPSIEVCPGNPEDYQVTVTIIDGQTPGISENVNITVDLEQLIIDPQMATYCVGETDYIYPEYGTWISNDPGIMTITNDGFITAISPGDATLLHTSDIGCQINVTYTVIDNPIVAVAGPSVICIGGTSNLFPDNGGTWVSTTPGIATVDNFGNVLGVSAGVALFTFTDDITGCSSTTDGSITVLPAPFIQNIEDEGICVGETDLLAAENNGIWQSSNPEIASIDNSGVITGLSPGFVTFSFTDITNGCTNTSNEIEIYPIPETSIEDNHICIGETTNAFPDTDGTWASYNPAIATVDIDGIVTGISSGTTNLVYTNSNGCTSDPSDTIFVNIVSPITFIFNDIACPGSDYTIAASSENGVEFIWSAPNGAIYFGEEIEIENFDDEHQGIYELEVIYSNGCSNTQTTFIEYDFDGCDYDFIGLNCSEAEVICDIDILDGLNNTMPQENFSGSQPDPLCQVEGGLAENISWIAFVAPEGEYQIKFTPFSCSQEAGGDPGAQIGVYTSCDFYESVYCNPACLENTVSIPSALFVPGETYYMFIDGCNGSVCSYELDFEGVYESICEEPCESDTTYIAGIAFIDENENGIFDSNEQPLRNVLVTLEPGNMSVLTNDDGSYEFILPNGEYSLSAMTNEGDWIQEELTIDNILIDEPCNDGYNFGFIQQSAPTESATFSMTNSLPRCDFETRVFITIENTGDEPLNGVIKFTFDEETSFVSTELPNYQISGNTITANVGPLNPFSPKTYKVVLQLPGGSGNLPLLDFSGELFNSFGEVISEYTYSDQLRCSYDPNDKKTYPDREGDANLTLMDENLEYTIRFQNNGNDTAFQVKIVDPLDPVIEPTSIRVINASHDVETCIDGNNLIFLFEDILLVDSMTNFAESQGYVSFRCNTKEGLAEMTPVHNHADIIFDTNDPIVTNQTLNTLVSALCTNKDTTIEATICEGDIYGGHMEAGVYTEVFELPFGCDSVVVLVLEVEEFSYTEQTVQICIGSIILIGDETYMITENAVIVDTMYSENGCISFINTYNIEAKGDFFDSVGEVSVCLGEPIMIDIGLEGTWESSDSDIISIDENGNFITHFAGEVTLTFIDSEIGCSDDLTIEVYPKPTLTIAGSPQICILEVAEIAADVEGSWTSSDPSIATINNNEEVAGISAGVVELIFTNEATGCSNSISIEVLAEDHPNCVVSTNNPAEGKIKLYPNPATESIIVESDIEWQSLQVFDTRGKTITIIKDPKQFKHKIDLSQYTSGVYIIALQDNEKVITKRFVVK